MVRPSFVEVVSAWLECREGVYPDAGVRFVIMTAEDELTDSIWRRKDEHRAGGEAGRGMHCPTLGKARPAKRPCRPPPVTMRSALQSFATSASAGAVSPNVERNLSSTFKPAAFRSARSEEHTSELQSL